VTYTQATRKYMNLILSSMLSTSDEMEEPPWKTPPTKRETPNLAAACTLDICQTGRTDGRTATGPKIPGTCAVPWEILTQNPSLAFLDTFHQLG
jgi:hypothetical protein